MCAFAPVAVPAACPVRTLIIHAPAPPDAIARACAHGHRRRALGRHGALQSGDARVKRLELGEERGENVVGVHGRHFGLGMLEIQGESVLEEEGFSHSNLLLN